MRGVQWTTVVLDCADPSKLAAFWSELLEGECARITASGVIGAPAVAVCATRAALRRLRPGVSWALLISPSDLRIVGACMPDPPPDSPGGQ